MNKNFEVKEVDNKKYIKVYGFTWKETYLLTKALEVLNGNNKSKIICREWEFIDLFQSHDKFGIHNVVVDDKFIEDFYLDFKIDESEIIMVICPPEEDQVYGVIQC